MAPGTTRFDSLPDVLEGVLEEGQLSEDDTEDGDGLGEAPEEGQVDSQGRTCDTERTKNAAGQEQVITANMSTAG